MRLRRGRIIFSMLYAGFVLGQAAIAQQPLSPTMVHERLVAVVPMIGAGTGDDPFRPAYVPEYLVRMPKRLDDGATPESPFATAKLRGEAPKAILGFTYVLSDDERYGLVEFQATDRSAFEPLLRAARNPGASLEPGLNRNSLPGGFDLVVFEVGKVAGKDIQRELRKYRKDFSLQKEIGGRP